MIEMELLGPLKMNQIDLDQTDIDRLTMYIKKLEKWGNIHALTSVSAREIPYVFVVEPIIAAKVLRNLIDPLRCLDMGTGFGNPGVAMSVYFKKSEFLLVDASYKKTALLRQIVDEAKFERVKVVTSRLEDLEEGDFDLVVSRGIGPLDRTLKYSLKFLKEGGLVAIFKAKIDQQELSTVKVENLKFERTLNLRVIYPSKEASRYLIVYSKSTSN
ncbi:MAG: hypothetical protein C0176_06465 [Mesoaciditoga sp.]|uniref:16S rRNA (guanine(527)-N(7))-methyltransferase RsmG n=2 Tax=Athalassotoga sp. TaxID=2022597 RepID=UPI000CC705CB|nr:MAG: hypothetical protein C0185_02320 [Mesoaciditoga sp.]PMP79129.1 MAG: hypothetical protein C0176_06465 [Mesoaciditoga sp.]HEU24585.1 methyltransferase domain-containing protein [Mesoaciditoga lauensis]